MTLRWQQFVASLLVCLLGVSFSGYTVCHDVWKESRTGWTIINVAQTDPLEVTQNDSGPGFQNSTAFSEYFQSRGCQDRHCMPESFLDHLLEKGGSIWKATSALLIFQSVESCFELDLMQVSTINPAHRTIQVSIRRLLPPSHAPPAA